MAVTAPMGSATPAVETARIRPDAAAPPLSGSAAPSLREPVDLVSLSPLATRHLALAPPTASLRQLGGLLQDAQQIEQVVRTPSPAVMGELAVEIGAAADALATQLPRPVETAARADDHADGQHPGPSHREPHGHVASDHDADHDASRDPDSIAGREQRLREDAATMLGRATDTLARMQQRAQGPPPAEAGIATRIAASALQVARARQRLDDAPSPPPSARSRWPRLLLATVLVLGLVAALCWLSRLDLHVARRIAGAAVGLCMAGWAWRRMPHWRRVRIELRR